MIRFTVDQQKTIEALVYVASQVPEVTRFHAAKILYFADTYHLAHFGRPVTGDHYVAMENGPVPSFAYDVLKGRSGEDRVPYQAGALTEQSEGKHPSYKAVRSPDLDYFSRSDISALDFAIEHCRNRSFGDISDETHQHQAWARARENGAMDFALMIGDDADLLEDAEITAAYGVL